jgi:hypothetical protein
VCTTHLQNNPHQVRSKSKDTCIKRSPFFLSCHRKSLLLRGPLSYKVTFSLSQRWPLNTGLTVFTLYLNSKKEVFNMQEVWHSTNTLPTMSQSPIPCSTDSWSDYLLTIRGTMALTRLGTILPVIREIQIVRMKKY